MRPGPSFAAWRSLQGRQAVACGGIAISRRRCVVVRRAVLGGRA
mgnify:CR=1 FL=1